MSVLKRIEDELKLAGFRLEPVTNETWTDDDYVQSIGNSVYEVCKLFCEQGHSGMSASIAKQLIQKLLIDDDTLSPLTNNENEWAKISEENGTPIYQSKRKFSCFSRDGLKTYYDVNDPDRKAVELSNKFIQ